MHAGGVSGGGGGYGKKDRDPLEVRKIVNNKKKSLICFGFALCIAQFIWSAKGSNTYFSVAILT